MNPVMNPQKPLGFVPSTSVSPFLSNRINVSKSPSTLKSPPKLVRQKRASVTMVEQNTVLALATGFIGIGGGIALASWSENQGKRGELRVNTQTCVVCKGAKTIVCNVCDGTGKNPINEAEPCSYCDGEGTITCFNCGGTGIQPRFLDRLSPDDFMD